jgi:recombination protein RecA
MSKKDAGKKNSAKLDKILANLSKSFGKDLVKKGSEALKAKEVIGTGHSQLDNAIGCGGLPLGIIAEFYGPEASGKGVTCMSVVSEAQKMGLRCLWVDAEHQCNPNWMITNGIDLDAIDIIDAHKSAEEILEIVEKLVESGDYSIVVVDSLAALVPQAEMDKKVGERTVGEMARIMSNAMRKLTPIAAKTKTTVIFINQTREKIARDYSRRKGLGLLLFHSS